MKKLRLKQKMIFSVVPLQNFRPHMNRVDFYP